MHLGVISKNRTSSLCLIDYRFDFIESRVVESVTVEDKYELGGFVLKFFIVTRLN